MGLFGGNRKRDNRDDGGRAGGGLAALAARFGRHEFYGQASTEDPVQIQRETLIPLYPEAARDPNAFLERLRREVLPAGGWALYGADRLMWELITDKTARQSEAGLEIMDASLSFLRENGVPPQRVRPYQWEHWIGTGGTIDTWLMTRPTPTHAQAPIRELAPGELRPVARLTADPQSNVILVRLAANGEHVEAIIDAPQSDDDPRRTQWEWKSAPTLYELYVQIGLTHQVPTPWYDPDLEPYFPLPAPRI
ncbi:MAG: hypothetical protein IPJ14_09690 [Kineosporiaceae bacterium]|nr:hypothetical protein [Kineosporiaceae bacterium]MBK7622917.1 hypothetical protein [Kineosporiaceae bacterium]